LLQKFVFIGGCAVDFLIDDEAIFDVRMTQDVDIITIFNGNSQIVAEIQGTSSDIKNYLCEELNNLLLDSRFKTDCIAGHLGTENKRRLELVHQRIKNAIGYSQRPQRTPYA
jgi:hypothetical protein